MALESDGQELERRIYIGNPSFPPTLEDLPDVPLQLIASFVAEAGSSFSLNGCSRRLGTALPPLATRPKNGIRALLRNRGRDALDVAIVFGASIPSDDRCRLAARDGNLVCLRHVHEQGCPWYKETCEYAAWNGHLDCLRYAHENQCPWDEETCRCAAANGHLDCLRYAYENGCPWDRETCYYAAEKGHLDCLRYAHENGCPWNEWTCRCAAWNGHSDCLLYMREQLAGEASKRKRKEETKRTDGEHASKRAKKN